MLKFSTSLKKNHEFRRLYSRGKSAATPLLVVYCLKNGHNYNQIGITVTKKLGKAVQRNRVRRRLKEIYRLSEEKFSVGYNIIVVARTKSRYASFSQLRRAFLGACSGLGLLAERGGVGAS